MSLQDVKKSGGVAAIAAQVSKIKAEAEKLEVMDKAAGILAELLYTEQLLTDIKEYRSIMLHVSLPLSLSQDFYCSFSLSLRTARLRSTC